MQGSDMWREIEDLGIQLSLKIDCSFNFSSYELYGKPVFQCKHGILFPVFAIRGAVEVDDWSVLEEAHKEYVHK